MSIEHHQPSIQQILIDNTDKILSHCRDNIQVMYRKGIVDLLDEMIISIRIFGRYVDNDDMIFMPYKLIKLLEGLFAGRHRFSADRTELNNKGVARYRDIPIYPYDNEYDEIYLISAQAFLLNNATAYPKYGINHHVVLTNNSLVARGTTWACLTKKLTDKELKLKRFERDSSDIPQEVILWELENRGII